MNRTKVAQDLAGMESLALSAVSKMAKEFMADGIMQRRMDTLPLSNPCQTHGGISNETAQYSQILSGEAARLWGGLCYVCNSASICAHLPRRRRALLAVNKPFDLRRALLWLMRTWLIRNRESPKGRFLSKTPRFWPFSIIRNYG
jgi:hypothetical protein